VLLPVTPTGGKMGLQPMESPYSGLAARPANAFN